MSLRRCLIAVLALGLIGSLPCSARAQDMGGPPPPPDGAGGPGGDGGPGGPPPDAPDGGDGGGPGGPAADGAAPPQFDPQEMRQRMQQAIQEQLNVTDVQWPAIQAQIEKIMQLRSQLVSGRGMPGRFGPPQDANADQASNAVAAALRDLRTTLQDRNASVEQINAKLKALHDARDKVRQRLIEAQDALKKLLTPRQEATLVARGILD